MAEVLTQSEIDALLAAVSSGDVKTEEPGTQSKGKDWIAYDLTSQDKVVRGRFAALQGIHDRFCRHFRASLTSMFKKHVTVKVLSTDFPKFSDYIGNILLPASVNICSMENLRGSMIFVFGSKLTYALLDGYYGGKERPYAKIGGHEEFTLVENRLLAKVCQKAIKDMQEAWRLNFPLSLSFLRAESNPLFIGTIHGSEPVIVTTFEVEFEMLSGSFTIIVQLRCLEPIRNQLSVNLTGEMEQDVSTWKDHWIREIMDFELNLKALLGTTRVDLKKLSSLAVGDSIVLESNASDPIAVEVEGLKKFRGLSGVSHSSRAIQLTEVVKGETYGAHQKR